MARKISVEIIGDSRSLERAFSRSGKAADKFHVKVAKTGIGIAKGLAVAGGAAVAFSVAVGVKAVKAASNLGEQINKNRVVFGKGAKMILAFGKTTASSMGISNEKALEFAGTFGNMLVPMGIARLRAAQISKELVKLAADMASFNNASPEEVLEALRAGLAGETEPLRRFGIFLNQDRIIAEAVSSGIVKMTKDTTKIKAAHLAVSKAISKHTDEVKKHGANSREAQEAVLGVELAQDKLSKALAGTTPKLTAQQKALATHNIIQKDTRDAQGDFARTLGSSLPNAIRVLKAQISDLMAAFGKGLLPVVTRAAQILRTKLADPKVRAFIERLGFAVGNTLLRGFVEISQWFNAHWTDIQSGFRTTVQILRSAIKVAGQLKSVLMTITTPLRIQFKILLAIWDKVLGMISTGAGIASHLPFVGDKFRGVQTAVDSARQVLRNPLAKGKKKPPAGKGSSRLRDYGKPPSPIGGARARGGPVAAGVSYRVGERGPEIFTPGASGSIAAGGGGGTIVVPVYLDGREIARAISPHQDRARKNRSSQTRGRHGGNAWST